MAYLGRQPIVGNYQVLDALTATTTDTYALTKNSVAVFPQTPANCIVSLNGVIQAPFDSYTISGSNIVFASALTASDSIDFITVLGDVLNVGTVSDGTIGISKLSATGTPSSSTFLRGDNSWQEAGGGKVLQVVSSTYATQTDTSSTSYSDTGLSASITPSSTSSKVLVFVNHTGLTKSTSDNAGKIQLLRNSISLIMFENDFGRTGSTALSIVGGTGTNYLDSPATTSATTYKTQFACSVIPSGTIRIGQNNSVQTMTLMEIAV